MLLDELDAGGSTVEAGLLDVSSAELSDSEDSDDSELSEVSSVDSEFGVLSELSVLSGVTDTLSE